MISKLDATATRRMLDGMATARIEESIPAGDAYRTPSDTGYCLLGQVEACSEKKDISDGASQRHIFRNPWKKHQRPS